MYGPIKVEEFTGKTVKSIQVIDNETIVFEFTDDSEYKMYHQQDCCESVYLENEEGLKALEGQKIIYAYESSNSGEANDFESCTWTFYIIQGEKSSATLRWYGSSNGYYSESVDIYETREADNEKPSRFNLENETD